MRPLPDITDTVAMLRKGRLSALHHARNDLASDLRDLSTYVQSANGLILKQHAQALREIADRMEALSNLWEQV